MSDKVIVVPEGMGSAVAHAVFNEVGKVDYHPQIRIALEAALRWLSENPIVPTEADVMGILQERVESHHISGEEYCAIPPATVRFVIREWQRRMFLAPVKEKCCPTCGLRQDARLGLAPEPKVPEAIKDLLYASQSRVGVDGDPWKAMKWIEESDRLVLAAFRRGQQCAKMNSHP